MTLNVRSATLPLPLKLQQKYTVTRAPALLATIKDVIGAGVAATGVAEQQHTNSDWSGDT